MKIGILSDTHLRINTIKIRDFIQRYLSHVDLIIHAGDYNDINVIDTIKACKKFVGVYGNNDTEKVKESVNYKEIIEIKGYKIGICHGHGKVKTTLERAYDEFADKDVDIIFFGHSHQPLIKTKGRTIMINPGSLTCKRRERWFSYVILELQDERITVSMNFFEHT